MIQGGGDFGVMSACYGGGGGGAPFFLEETQGRGVVHILVQFPLFLPKISP